MASGNVVVISRGGAVKSKKSRSAAGIALRFQVETQASSVAGTTAALLLLLDDDDDDDDDNDDDIKVGGVVVIVVDVVLET
jgi:hypothetical protein